MTENNELSERELEILQLVATGASNKEIAQTLTISTNTVKVHLRNVFAKIEVSSRTEAAMYAVQHGIVETPGEEADNGKDSQEAGGALGARTLQESTKSRFSTWGLVVIGFLVISSLALIYFRSMDNIQPASTSVVPVPTQSLRWQVRSEMRDPRIDMAIASYGNLIYIFGGENPSGITGNTDIYDPETDTWSTGPAKPVPVSQVEAGIVGGKAVIPGGRDSQGKILRVVEIYDMLSMEWSMAADLPVPLAGYSLAVYEGGVYVFGGWDGERSSDRVFRYDPEEDTWQELTSLPTARAFAGAIVVEDSIYVIGGYDGTEALTENEVYFPARESQEDRQVWESRAPMPLGRYAMGMTNVVDIIYAIGGISSDGPLAGSITYFPLEDRWESFELPNSQSWARMGAVLFGTRLYLIGGEIDGSPSGQNLAYQAIYTVSLPSINK
jgi:DNA-binding CsgD family transcriptional regulator